MNRRHLLKSFAASAPLLVSTSLIAAPNQDWRALARDVRAQMAWAWRNYVERCFGQDQIKPVSGGAEPFFFPGGPPLGLSIVEALDTLYVMGLDAETEEGVRWIADHLHFDIDGEVQVFETGIRIVGGLLSGWHGTKEKKLLALAKDMADRLSPAFTKSPTGMPYRFVNLRTGAVRDPVSFPAEIGTYIAEWGTLSKATGDGRYYNMAKRAVSALFDRRSKIDLVADTINIETGAWASRRASIGPPSDSYFEYLWDGWQLFGDADFKRMYDVHAAAIVKYQAQESGGHLWFPQVDFETGAVQDHHQSELAAFYAGLLGQGGDMTRGKAYLASWTDVQARFGVLPEGYDYARAAAERVTNELRPEFADSCLNLFLLEPDDRYRELARIHYETMKKTSRAAHGFSIIDDITTSPMKQGDLCPGYWWSEQMKYYWLLFSDTDRFDYKNNYLSTEGNVFAGLNKSRFNPAFATVTTLFFMWGFITASIDPLVPSVKAVFSLTYAESMLTQFAFFLAYGVISLPAAFVLEKVGYARTILLALGAMLAGCLLMPVATHANAYWFVLIALFVIAGGITQLQVAANPLAAMLGKPEGSHFRLTLSQTFNSLGTVLAPVIGSYLILRGGVFEGAVSAASRDVTLRNVDTQFLAIAAILVLLGLFLWRLRRLLHVPHELDDANASPFAAFTSRWALFGGLAIFLYVGAEVSIGSMMINFLHQPSIMNVSFAIAGRLLGLYWGGAMVGRALGSAVLTRVPAGKVLAAAACVALLLCLVVTQSDGLLTLMLGGTAGKVAGAAALAVGFFNSVMFPTIFTLTLERSTAPTPSTSGLLCMAIVGGAILPVLTGFTADHIGLTTAFFVPFTSYVCIAIFALAGRRQSAQPVATPISA